MPKYGYSAKIDEPNAKAYGKELRVSPKDSMEICRAIRGLPLSVAKDYLEKVKMKKKAIPYVRHNKKLAHKKGGVGPGAYPVKAAGEILKVLKNAEENAGYKGMAAEKLKVVHASASKGITMPGIIPRAFGRASPFNKPTTNVEIILKEAS
ncbi:MAG: 50S ribosomal protein L22 [Candidatus Hadarchaeota archaeon]